MLHCLSYKCLVLGTWIKYIRVIPDEAYIKCYLHDDNTSREITCCGWFVFIECILCNMGSSYIPNIHAIVGNQWTRRDLVFIIRTPLYSSYSCHGAYGIKGSPAIDTHVPNLDVIECHPIHIQWSYLDCLISTCTCYPTSIGMPVHSQARAIVSAHFLLIQCPWIPHIPFLKEMSQKSSLFLCVNALPGWCRLQKQLQTRDGLKDWIEHRVQILICLRNDNVIVLWVLVNPS